MTTIRQIKETQTTDHKRSGAEQAAFKDSILNFFHNHHRSLQAHVPVPFTAQRILAIAEMTAKRDRLAKCVPSSIINSLIDCITLGLEPDTTLELAHLIPYWNANKQIHEARVVIGYRGYIQLAYRNPRVTTFGGRVAYERDHFDFSYGFPLRCEHKPLDPDRLNPAWFFSTIQFDNRGGDFEVMSNLEMQRFRDSLPEGRSSAWKTDFVAMGRKTMVRALAKRIPLSAALAHAVQIDESAETGGPRRAPLLIDQETGKMDEAALAHFGTQAN